MGFLSSIGKVLKITGPIAGALTGNPAVGAGLGGLSSALTGSGDDGYTTEDANNANAYLQREFAQNGIRWKVADAQAAGISPLVALGAQTNPAMASYVSSPSSSEGGFSGSGTDLSRAMAAGQTSYERLQERLLNTQIDGQEIDNAIRRSQLSKMTSQIGPAMPTGGQHDGNVMPEQTSVRTRYGDMKIPSPDYAQIMENYWPESWRYMFREGLYGVQDWWNSKVSKTSQRAAADRSAIRSFFGR